MSSDTIEQKSTILSLYTVINMQQIYSTEAFKVGIIAWDGMDLTDFTGPVEVLSHVRNTSRERLFKVTIAAESAQSETTQDVTVSRHVDIAEFMTDIAEIDVLIVPGGGGFNADCVPHVPGLKKVLTAFINLPPRNGHPRILLSICAAAFFLAETGVLTGKVATCHYASLPELQKFCNRYGGTHLVRQHYVDVGNVNGLDIVVSGGITSGFDATLYVVEKLMGFDLAEKSRATMDALWRREALPHGFT